jgi:hypothetical protein
MLVILPLGFVVTEGSKLTLQAMLKDSSVTLDPLTRLRMCLNVTSILEYIHKLGFVHRGKDMPA